MVCDVYFPDLDLIIEFDGPVHYFQPQSSIVDPHKEIFGANIEFPDLSDFKMPSYKLQERIVGAKHKKIIRFDYQVHNYMY